MHLWCPVLVINWIERAQDQVKNSKTQRGLSKPCDLVGQWWSQDLRLGGARLKDNIKRKII